MVTIDEHSKSNIDILSKKMEREDYYQVSQEGPAGQLFETVQGMTRFDEWLEREKERFAKAGIPAKIVRRAKVWGSRLSLLSLWAKRQPGVVFA